MTPSAITLTLDCFQALGIKGYSFGVVGQNAPFGERGGVETYACCGHPYRPEGLTIWESLSKKDFGVALWTHKR
jgi:hypothetical protein